MHWNDHSNLKGKHALFSPSQSSCYSLTREEIRQRLVSKMRPGVGTEIHEWSFVKIKRRHKVTSIRELVKQVDEYIFNKYYLDEYDTVSSEGKRLLKALKFVPQEVFLTVKDYINDSIEYAMDPEIVLYYSMRQFGTTDAISFDGDILRIHDLKTGSTPAKIDQLMGYDAMYCLEYKVDPYTIQHELRIYQNNDVIIANPQGDDIKPFMEKIKELDKEQLEFEEG